jgi:hypothetical protein
MQKIIHMDMDLRMIGRHDIVYNNRSAPLLLGDKNNTFVWNKPTIIFQSPTGTREYEIKYSRLTWISRKIELIIENTDAENGRRN